MILAGISAGIGGLNAGVSAPSAVATAQAAPAARPGMTRTAAYHLTPTRQRVPPRHSLRTPPAGADGGENERGDARGADPQHEQEGSRRGLPVGATQDQREEGQPRQGEGDGEKGDQQQRRPLRPGAPPIRHRVVHLPSSLPLRLRLKTLRTAGRAGIGAVPGIGAG